MAPAVTIALVGRAVTYPFRGSIAADAGGLIRLSDEAVKIMHQDITSEHGFSVPAMLPEKDLDAINRTVITMSATDTENLRAQGTVKGGLLQWSRQAMVTSTTGAVWGPQSPYRNAADLQILLLTLLMFLLPKLFFPKLFRARGLAASAMIEYMRKVGHETASGLVRKRYKHHLDRFGLSVEDIARGELRNTFAVLSNLTPCAFGVLYRVYSDDQVLANVCQELSILARESYGPGSEISNSVKLAGMRTYCPMLLNAFQETLRYLAVNPRPRVLIDNVLLDGHILIKKGSMFIIPALVRHSSVPVWGNDPGESNHRFAPKAASGRKKPNRVAFRAFGGGHVLCPGRHFATFDPRDRTKEWHVTYPGSDKVIRTVSEDITGVGE
ncbi:cytochrome P450 [Xylariaceae sp. AK1471]|nr:cytochrome P450 [Xylariaceae sp. AK1471]